MARMRPTARLPRRGGGDRRVIAPYNRGSFCSSALAQTIPALNKEP
jgi:hypothetical protein